MNALQRLPLFAALALGFVVGRTHAQNFKPLFNGKDLTGWKFHLKDDKADPLKTFVVKNGVIEVSGFPNGYLYTDKSYTNYVLRYSWRFPKEQPEKTTLNSGLLVHIQEPHQVWPKSVEPQGRYKDHGKIFFPGWPKDHKNEATYNEEAKNKAAKAMHEWNTTEVTCKADGSLEVRINGTLVATGKSPLTSGPIGFQSEAARIDFKDIAIKELK
jgi:hypothetical protein